MSKTPSTLKARIKALKRQIDLRKLEQVEAQAIRIVAQRRFAGTTTRLGHILCVDSVTIDKVIKNQTYLEVPTIRVGALIKGGKFSVEEIWAIRTLARRNTPGTTTRLAEIFGVDSRSIDQIIKRETYARFR